MNHDVFPITPQDLAAIVPACYAEFRPVVADGLTFFLRHLSAPRLAEVFHTQGALPADADLSRRLVRFLHACPALHKIGQVVARNRHLDRELRRHLQELESLEPHTPAEQWQPALERELASAAEEYHIRVGERPLAEGSVAVVVPLTWSDPADESGASPRQGVAKLLKPGVVARLDEDLAILARLAGYLEERGAAYGLPPLAYREILTEVADLLTQEVLPQQEQAHLRQAEKQFTGQGNVKVPRVLPFATDSLTAMERVDGLKVTDPGEMRLWRRPALFLATVRALLSDVLFNRDETVLFHGDPHAGNLLATPDGRLAILDWSLAGKLTTADRVQFSQILVGGWARDATRVGAAVAQLAGAVGSEDLIRRHVQKALASRRWCEPPGPEWAVGLLDALARAGLRFPPRLLLFRKTFLTLQGVLEDVCPTCSLEGTLMAEALVQLAWEWPVRWWRSWTDRDFGTHISSADLMALALRGGWPYAALKT